jgi:hypothetical protein
MKQDSGRWEYWMSFTDTHYDDYPVDAELYADDPTAQWPPQALSQAHGFDADTLELEVAIKLRQLRDANPGIHYIKKSPYHARTYKKNQKTLTQQTAKELRLWKEEAERKERWAKQNAAIKLKERRSS